MKAALSRGRAARAAAGSAARREPRPDASVRRNAGGGRIRTLTLAGLTTCHLGASAETEKATRARDAPARELRRASDSERRKARMQARHVRKVAWQPRAALARRCAEAAAAERRERHRGGAALLRRFDCALRAAIGARRRTHRTSGTPAFTRAWYGAQRVRRRGTAGRGRASRSPPIPQRVAGVCRGSAPPAARSAWPASLLRLSIQVGEEACVWRA